MVWPALLPPWKRTTTSAFSASRSVILPLPSSPHWAPTMTIDGMAVASLSRELLHAAIAPHDRDEIAHLVQAGNGPRADLVAQLVDIDQVRRDDHRALLLPALVDDRVELLEDPVRALLGAEVVDVQQVHPDQPLEQLHVRRLGTVLVGLLDVREQARQRVDRDGAAGLQRGLRHQHRERGLAGADVAEEPEAFAVVEVGAQVAHVAANLADERRVHVGDRVAVEAHPAEALRDARPEPLALLALRLERAAVARPRGQLVDLDPTGAVADAELADRHQRSSPPRSPP